MQQQGYVTGETKPRTVEMAAGSDDRIGKLVNVIQDGGGSITVDGPLTNAQLSAAIVNTNIKPITNPSMFQYRNIDLDETGVVVKNVAGGLYGFLVINSGGNARFVKFYNKATAPTNADTPLLTVPVQAVDYVVFAPPWGIPFTAGIGLRATTGVADNDVGAPGANDVVIHVFYG